MSVVISGSYGFGNLGDEAILREIVKSVYNTAKQEDIVLLSWYPDRTLERHYDIIEQYGIRVLPAFFLKRQVKQPVTLFGILRSMWHIATCRLFIWGGGGLVHDESGWFPRYLHTFRIARLCKRRIMVFAIGAKLLSGHMRRLVEKHLNNADVITVRDFQSKEVLYEMGVRRPIHVTADPAVKLNTIIRQRSVRRNVLHIGINMRTWFDRPFQTQSDRAKMSQLTEFIAEVLDWIGEMFNVIIHGIPMDKGKDIRALSSLGHLLEHNQRFILHTDLSDPDDARALIGEMDALIGMRCHSIIFAAGEFTPFLAISYAPKVESFVKRLKLRSLSFDVEDLIGDGEKRRIFKQQILVLLTEGDQIRRGIEEGMKALEEEKRKNTALMAILLESR